MRHAICPTIDTSGRITLETKIMSFVFVLLIPTLAAGLGVWLLCTGHVSALDLWILLGSYVLTGLGVTVGYHRLFTHRAFETFKPIRYLLALLGSTAAEGGTIAWSSQHRAHHGSSDAPGDPHSPKLGGLWHSHYGHVFNQVELIDPERFTPDLIREPFLCWLERYAAVGVTFGMVVPAAVGFAIGGTWQAAATALLWGGLVRLFLITHATGAVNSLCHVFGSRPFDTGDNSGNVWWLMPITLGESWHSGHHCFPTSAKHGLQWWELDPSWCIIWLMEKVGLARNVVRVSSERIKERRKPAKPNPAAP